jgi:hypothetical protein
MDGVVGTVSRETGLEPEKAELVVETVIEYIQKRLALVREAVGVKHDPVAMMELLSPNPPIAMMELFPPEPPVAPDR